MENAANALGMAAAVLIFIIAIASSFSLFGTAKETADSIIGMRDKQAYLEAAELDNGILYTSSSAIRGNNNEDNDYTTEYISGVTKKGDRVVKTDEVISTIHRYSIEKYGVTIIKLGKVIARFDTNTESFIQNNWNLLSDEDKINYTEEIKKRLETNYVGAEDIELEFDKLYTYKSNNTNKIGAIWLGNPEDIQARINTDIQGNKYNFISGEYQGVGLLEELKDNQIIEVTNEIDQSKYLLDTDEGGNKIETSLLQNYEMPTVEVVYIVY